MTPPAPRPGDPRPRARVRWWRASRAAFGGGFGRPILWPFSLLAFLLRGGWFLFLVPIVVVPSTVGVSTFVGPLAVTPAGPSDGFLHLVAGVVGALGAWILVGGLVAGACEAFVVLASSPGGGHGAERVRREREATRRVSAGLAARVLSARLIAMLPLVLAIAWSVPRTLGAAYSELTTPADPALPLPLRVLRDVPEVVAIAAAAWVVAETIGALAARRVVLFDEGPLGAVVRGLVHVVRRPLVSVATAGLTVVGSIIVVGPALVIAGFAWGRVAAALPAQDVPAEALAWSVAFVLAWTAGLVLAAGAASWRSVAWTLEVARADRPAAALRASRSAGRGGLVESEGTSAAS